MAAAIGVPSPAQFIGSKISLISKSEIRYEGILYALDVTEATISLAKVKSFGTEDRPTDRPVGIKEEVYEFIIFRGTDIRVIDVIEPPKTTVSLTGGLSNDPAIVEASHSHSQSSGQGQGAVASAVGQVKANLFSNPPPQIQIQQQPPRLTNVFDGLLGQARISPGPANDGAQAPQAKSGRGNRRGRQQQQQQNQNQNQNNQNNDGGQQRQRQGQRQRRGNNFNGGQQHPQQMQMSGGGRFRRRGFNQRSSGFGRKNNGMMPPQQAKVTFEVEFDFEKANEELIAQFEKTKLDDSIAGNPEKENMGEKTEEVDMIPFYQKENFFDNISCEASEVAKGKSHRQDWRAERKLNSETFGNAANRRTGGGGFQPRGGYGRGGGDGGFYRGYDRSGYQPYRGYGFYNGYQGYNGGYGGYGGGGFNGRYRGSMNRGGMF